MSNKYPNFTEMAKEVYAELHEDAPPDVQTWEQLHVVERNYLVKFTQSVYLNALAKIRVDNILNGTYCRKIAHESPTEYVECDKSKATHRLTLVDED